MPLLSGFSQFLPTLGRQLGFNWELLGLGNIVGSNTFWQIILVLIGMSASIAFLKAIIRNHQKKEKGVLRYRRFRYVPIIFLAGIYILIFMFTHF